MVRRPVVRVVAVVPYHSGWWCARSPVPLAGGGNEVVMANRSSESASERAGFGVMLRGLRERALVSQEQLAERSGLSLRAIGNLEQGRVLARMIERFCANTHP